MVWGKDLTLCAALLGTKHGYGTGPAHGQRLRLRNTATGTGDFWLNQGVSSNTTSTLGHGEVNARSPPPWVRDPACTDPSAAFIHLYW